MRGARFPIGLTLAALIVFSGLIGLGVWQVHRLAWKEALLARIAALKTAPARPLVQVLAAPGDQGFVRVAVACDPAPRRGPQLFRYAVADGVIGWRLLGACRAALGPYDGILVDRGLATGLKGFTAPTPVTDPPMGEVAGVLRTPGGKPWLGPAVIQRTPRMVVARLIDGPTLAEFSKAAGLAHPAPYLLAAESERPAAPGLQPRALPEDIPNNHFVYALTWFALAGILAWFYLAMLLQRYRR
ncbi:MAG: SURF1 family protein [Alphaproteobacteria bacterium]|nr:SURF1 family protein [Alphaproteobacteria bacterium]